MNLQEADRQAFAALQRSTPREYTHDDEEVEFGDVCVVICYYCDHTADYSVFVKGELRSKSTCLKTRKGAL